MTLLFLIIGVGILAMLPVAWVSNWTVVSADPPAQWRYAWRLRWPIGIAFGIGSVFMFYPVHGTDDMWYRIYGVPFPAHVVDEHGLDYVGCPTPLSMIMNFVTWLFFPHLPLWISSFVFRCRKSHNEIVAPLE